MADETNFESVKLERPAQGKSKEDKYKSGLRLAMGVIVLLAIVLTVTIITSRSGSNYRAGYVDGWNGCREKQIELLKLGDVDILPIDTNISSVMASDNSTDSTDAQIQIVVE